MALAYKYKHYIYIITEREFRYVWTEGAGLSAEDPEVQE